MIKLMSKVRTGKSQVLSQPAQLVTKQSFFIPQQFKFFEFFAISFLLFFFLVANQPAINQSINN